MLTNIPPAKLLEGVADSLQAEVAPRLDDEFARMQLRAIDELLRNLAPRIGWIDAELGSDVAGIERLLAALEEEGMPAATATGDDGRERAPDPAARRLHLLGRLEEAIAWAYDEGHGSDRSRAAARARLAEQLEGAAESERGRLRSGLYS